MSAIKVAESTLPTDFGTFRLLAFQSADKTDSAIVLVMGNLEQSDTPIVRIHSQCLTGDVFRSGRCDCGAQLEFALQAIAAAGAGILIYELQEGRGIGLMNKILAYQLQDAGRDTVEANEQLGFGADERDYALCADILQLLGIKQLRLLSNNPEKFKAIEKAGITIAERLPIEIAPTDTTQRYLLTKKSKLGHLLSSV